MQNCAIKCAEVRMTMCKVGDYSGLLKQSKKVSGFALLFTCMCVHGYLRSDIIWSLIVGVTECSGSA